MPLTEPEYFDEEFFNQFPELAGTARDMAGQLIPINEMSPQDMNRLFSLQTQAQKLAPMQSPAMQGNNRIAGNPYSVDSSPIGNAVQQGLVNLINANRQRKLLGDPDKANEIRGMAADKPAGVQRLAEREARKAEGILPQLQRLSMQQSQAESQRESQQDFLARMFPDLVGKVMDSERALAQEDKRGENRVTLENLRGQQRIELEGLRHENNKELQTIKSTLGSEGPSASVITNFANMGRSAGDTLFKQADAMDERLADPVAIGQIRREARAAGIDPGEAIAELQREANHKRELAWQMYGIGSQAAEQGGMDPALIQRYENLLGEVSGRGALDDL